MSMFIKTIKSILLKVLACVLISKIIGVVLLHNNFKELAMFCDILGLFFGHLGIKLVIVIGILGFLFQIKKGIDELS